MEPLGTEWVEELHRQIQDHILYFPLNRRREELESKANEILLRLDPQDRTVLLDLLQVNRKIEVCLTQEAYLAGIQVGERRMKKGTAPSR